ncbi:MAG: glycoside hydrolase domain-containing protein, partial [Bacteroidota bacterium]
FTTLGFYPVHPANGAFVLGQPQVSKAIIHLNQDRTFTVSAPADADGVVKLNGKPLDKTISYESIMRGGSLEF